jgi:adenylate kinase family enzyme
MKDNITKDLDVLNNLIKNKLRRSFVLVMVGLCGSGKSTLANKLSKKFNAKIISIGESRDIIKKLYDERQPELKCNYLNNNTALLLELQSWLLLFYAVSREIELNNDIILDTSGLNKRLNFLIDNLYLCGIADVIKIKLECPLNILKNRLENRKEKQNGFFPYEYKDHMDLNRSLIKSFKEAKSNFVINTSKLNANQAYQKVVKELKKYNVK